MPDSVPAQTAAPAESAPAAKSEAPAAAETKTPEARKFKIPFDEFGEVELPEQEVIGLVNQFAKLKSGDLKARKQLEEIEAAFGDDAKLEELLRKHGKDPAKLAEAMLAKHLKSQFDEANLSPEQRRVKELEAKLAEVEAAKKADEDRKKKQAEDAEVEAAFKELQATAAAALKETSLPPELHSEPFVLRQLGQLMKRNEELKANVPPVVLAKQLESALTKELDFAFTKLTPESLVKRLGPKTVREIVKAYAAGLQPKAAEEAPKPAARRTESVEKLTPEELRWKARELARERSREEQRLLRQTTTGREARFYGKR